MPPDLTFAGPDDLDHGRAILIEHAGAERAGQALATILGCRERSIADPHWTLQYLGVRRSRQGRGLGAAAVAPTLARIDADWLPCGLVSTNARNVPFYERFGFAVVAEVTAAPGTATLRPMHRPSRVA